MIFSMPILEVREIMIPVRVRVAIYQPSRGKGLVRQLTGENPALDDHSRQSQTKDMIAVHQVESNEKKVQAYSGGTMFSSRSLTSNLITKPSSSYHQLVSYIVNERTDRVMIDKSKVLHVSARTGMPHGGRHNEIRGHTNRPSYSNLRPIHLSDAYEPE